MAIRLSTVPEDIAMYGRVNRDSMEYLRSRNEEKMESWTSRARDRFERVRDEVLKTASFESVARRLEAAVRITRSKFRDDSIRQLTDIGDFQNPPDQMLNYLGANTELRKLLARNQCDGWSGRYVDDEPGRHGEDNYWYRRVTNGIYMTNPETGRTEANIYMEKLKEGDAELDIDRQTDVLFSWSVMEEYFQAGNDDPTSKWNSKLT